MEHEPTFEPPRDINFVRRLAFEGLIHYTEKRIISYETAKEIAALIRLTELPEPTEEQA